MHELRHDDPRSDAPSGRRRRALPADLLRHGRRHPAVDQPAADAWRWGLADAAVAALLPTPAPGAGLAGRLRRPRRRRLRRVPRRRPVAAWPTRAGRTRSTRSGSTTAASAGPPIALCEVQGYAHRAALDAAELLDAFGGRTARRTAGGSTRRELADRFRARFWVDGPLGPFPALALDGDGRPVDSLTSNIGHLLGTGLLNPDEEAQVARLLGSPRWPAASACARCPRWTAGSPRCPTTVVRSGRTTPRSRCSGWPRSARTTARGRPAPRRAARRRRGVRLPAARAVRRRRRAEVGRPVPYPAACRPQAWAAAAAVTVLQATLGLCGRRPARRGPRPAAAGAWARSRCPACASPAGRRPRGRPRRHRAGVRPAGYLSAPSAAGQELFPRPVADHVLTHREEAAGPDRAQPRQAYGNDGATTVPGP